jgi:hypothetical protein
MGVRRVATAGGEVLVVAVADGAGSAVHGGAGAARAVATALDVIAVQLETRQPGEVDAEAVLVAVRAAIQQEADAVAAGRMKGDAKDSGDRAATALATDAASPPSTDATDAATTDAAVGTSTDANVPILAAAEATIAPTTDGPAMIARATTRDFACTLLCAVVGPDSASYLQVGDGAIVVRDPALRLVFAPTRGEFANQTVFVTSPHAAQHLQHMRGAATDALAVLSDGLECVALDLASGTPFAGFFDPFLAIVGELPPGDAEAEGALSGELADFLGSASIDARTGDDRTLVVAMRGGG